MEEGKEKEKEEKKKVKKELSCVVLEFTIITSGSSKISVNTERTAVRGGNNAYTH